MMRLLLVLLFLVVAWSAEAWTTRPLFSTARPRFTTTRQPTSLYSSTEDNEVAEATQTALEKTAKQAVEEAKDLATFQEEEEEEEEEWEYLEYEDLEEGDFVNSEWLVGTNFDNKPNKIDETWVRCLASDDAGAPSQPCIWGDGAKGKWSFDRASQYFSLSKEHFYGKEIWAGIVDDYYYLQGTVRGWTYVTPAEVLGQWQARRLGVDKEEAGVAPWFEEEEEENDEKKTEDATESKEEKSASMVTVTSEASDSAKPSDESKLKEEATLPKEAENSKE